MKTAFRLALFTALVALGCWLWTIFFPSPEKVVRQKIASLATTATFALKDSAIARALKAQKASSFFSPDAQLIVNAPGHGQRTLSGLDEIKETVTAAFNTLPSLGVEFLDLNIKLNPGSQSADVNLTAKVRVGDSKDFDVQEMLFLFKKIDGHWLIARAETVKVFL